MNQMVNAANGLAINQVVSRQMQEVQGAIFMAKQFPRDETASLNRIKSACRNKHIAEAAEYVFPRGGQDVTGPSIRLAEVIAQAWGNIDYGIIELSNDSGLSEMMAYAWDLETNVRRQMIFTVRHERDTRSGKRKLTDNRDIYEITANMGSRRVRACILGVIPSYVVEEALDICKRTQLGETEKTMEKAVKATVDRFGKKHGVSLEMLCEYVGKPVGAWEAEDVEKLRAAGRSIEEGMAAKADFFPSLAEPQKTEVAEAETAAAELNEQLGLGGDPDVSDPG